MDLTGLPADISAHDCSSLLLRLGLVDWGGEKGVGKYIILSSLDPIYLLVHV